MFFPIINSCCLKKWLFVDVVANKTSGVVSGVILGVEGTPGMSLSV